MSQTLTNSQLELCNLYWKNIRHTSDQRNMILEILNYFQETNCTILYIVKEYAELFKVYTSALKGVEAEFSEWLEEENIDYNTRDMHEEQYAILHGLNFDDVKTSDTPKCDIPKYIESVLQKNQYKPKY